MQERVFHLNASRFQAALSLGLFLLAALVILCIPQSWLLKCTSILLLVFYAYYLFSNVLPRCQPTSILSLEKQPDGWWRLMCPARHFQATLQSATTVTQWVTVVHFKAATGQRLSAVISRDMLSKRAYRHLLCRLIEPQAEACDLHQSQQR